MYYRRPAVILFLRLSSSQIQSGTIPLIISSSREDDAEFATISSNIFQTSNLKGRIRLRPCDRKVQSAILAL